MRDFAGGRTGGRTLGCMGESDDCVFWVRKQTGASWFVDVNGQGAGAVGTHFSQADLMTASTPGLSMVAMHWATGSGRGVF